MRDLDAARAARAEALGEPRMVSIGGREYKLVPEVSIDFAEHAAAGRLRDAARTLLADESEADAFLANKLSQEDFEELFAEYGIDLGEASASAPSSKPAGKR